MTDDACNKHPEGCPENSHRGHRYDKSQATPTGKAVAEMIDGLQCQLREVQAERDALREELGR